MSHRSVDPTTQYAVDVVLGNIVACHYVKQACQRHLDDLRRPDVWFDDKAADKFFRYCGYLRHYKGEYRGQPVILEPWQKFVFGCIYGWKRCDLVAGEWIRTEIWRFHYAYLEVPRKNGKTTIAAAGASYDAAMMENTGAEVYCLATKEDQAKLLYKDICAYIHQSTELQDTFEVLKAEHTAYVQNTGRTSFIKPLGSDSQRLDGLNPLSAYADELHAWPDRALWDVIEEAFGARKNWHMIAITTAGINKQGICYKEREHLINILEGRIKNDDKFGIIYTVDPEDRKDLATFWKSHALWKKANPNLGTGKEWDYMVSKCLKVEQIPSQLNSFLNKQLNIWTDAAEAWIQNALWKKLERGFTLDDLAGYTCEVGIDLAKVNDLSAVAYYFAPQSGLDCHCIVVHYYIPEENIGDKEVEDGVTYRDWAEQGWLTITPGKTTDYEYIYKDIIRNGEKVVINSVGYDRKFATEVTSNLEKEGYQVEPCGMGFYSLSAPSFEFERLLVEEQLAHDENPITEWCVANAVISKDAAGGIKPDKEKSENKIDGLVAMVVAIWRRLNPVEKKKKPSPYRNRGLRTLD